MEISRDSLLRVVKATRMSLSMAEDMRKMLADPQNRTFADVIAGLLTDALFIFAGEILDVGQDFCNDARTMKILMNKTATDEEATQMILQLYWDNHPRQPKPQIIDRNEMKKQAKHGCGYIAPEANRNDDQAD